MAKDLAHTQDLPASSTLTELESTESPETRYLTPRQLMVIAFRRNRLAVLGLILLLFLYLGAALCEFIAPYDPLHRFSAYLYAPPSRIHIRDEQGDWHWLFIYALERYTDRQTFQRTFIEDTSTRYSLRLFVRGDEYKFWGLWKTDLHLFGPANYADAPPIFLLGSDSFGRDLFSRILYGSRLSLTIGLVGVALSLVVGLVLGGISGLYGGLADNIIQRIIEFIRSMPTIPMWMGLAAALPADWPQIRVYFGITIILSFVGWTTLARVIRGKFLALREEDFVLAARQAGASEWYIIWEHLVPSFMSYVLVHLSLAIPGMIIGETALSFLGLGLAAPAISWGVLLKSAQQLQEIAFHPWILSPALFVIVAVLAFNFLGDGLRDAADPYAEHT